MFLRTAASAAAGGAGAVAAGGKFANGALTAGMAHLFNHEGYHDGYGRRQHMPGGMGPMASGKAQDASWVFYEGALWGSGVGPATKAGIGWIELGYGALASRGIYSTTTRGTAPAWSTVRGRFWNNMADIFGARLLYGKDNIIRMGTGLAPRRFNGRRGRIESKELSHEPIPMRQGGTKIRPRWPEDHAKVDPFRHLGD